MTEELKDPAEYDDFAAAIRHNERVTTRRYDSVGPVKLETVYETIIHWDEGGGKRSRRELARRIVDLYAAPLQRTAEPVQEPFCYVYEYDSPYGLHREFYPREYNGMKPSRTVPLYTAPPPRKPLTDEELDALAIDEDGLPNSHIEFARAIERAHGIGDSDE